MIYTTKMSLEKIIKELIEFVFYSTNYNPVLFVI